MRQVRLLMAVPLLLSSVPAGPVRWLPASYTPRDATCREPLPKGMLRIAGAHLQKARGRDLISLLGPSRPHTSGDAGDSLTWRCWKAANGDGTILMIENEAMRNVLSILGAEVPFPRDECASSSAISKRIKTGSGVHLGMRRSDVIALIGPANNEGPGWFERSCLSRQQMTPTQAAALHAPAGQDFYDVSSSFIGVEKNGKLIGFRTTLLESY